MEKTQADRIANTVLELAPAAWLGCFFLFVARAWLEVGHLPSYSNPDPKNLGMDVHHRLLWLSLYLLPWLILGYGVIRLKKKLSVWRIVGLLVLPPTILLVAFGPQLLVFPAIWATPVVSFLTLALILAKGAASKRVNSFYGISLLVLGVWLYVDPFGLMEWFYD
jgi:hypothetical protein